MANLVFLGGTVGNNGWRNKLIAALKSRGIDTTQLFNPVVDNWDDNARRREEEAKRNATHVVYYLASPEQDTNPLSAYSMVEATMALYDKENDNDAGDPLVVFDFDGIGGHALKALKQTQNVLLNRFGAASIYSSFDELVDVLTEELK
jgi:hypothetical protein